MSDPKPADAIYSRYKYRGFPWVILRRRDLNRLRVEMVKAESCWGGAFFGKVNPVFDIGRDLLNVQTLADLKAVQEKLNNLVETES